MLNAIRIDRFKSIRKQHVSFGAVNLFIGGNGSGKSNVLEAIGLLAAALSRGVDEKELERKGLRISPPAVFKSAFKNFDLPKTLRLEADLEQSVSYEIELSARDDDLRMKFHSESLYHRGNRLIGRSGRGIRCQNLSIPTASDPARSIWDQVRIAFEFPSAVITQLDQLASYAIFAPQTEFLRGTQTGTAATLPVGLHGEGLPLAVRSLLSHLNRVSPTKRKLISSVLSLVWLPGWASRVMVGEISRLLRSGQIATPDDLTLFFVDKYMHNKRNRVTAYDSSEGSLFLLFAAVLLTHDEVPKIFAFDNVDNSLNPRMTKKLLEMVIRVCCSDPYTKENIGPRQVFMTSHNPTALDAFDIFDDMQRVFVVKRDDDGHTTINRLTPPQGMNKAQWIKEKAGMNLSELWIEGFIDGALS